jgi:hypothetical protein
MAIGRALLAVGLFGCRVLGINGPPAITCPAGDIVCGGVSDALETVRANIGGTCGTPDMGASMDLFEIGPAAIPFLLAALDDRDVEVARFAAAHVVDLGGGAELDRWCASRREALCTAQLQRHRALPASLAGTYWQLPSRRSIEDGAMPATRLVLAERDGVVDGELCEADAHCLPVHGLRAGTRLELLDPTRGTVVLFSGHVTELGEHRTITTGHEARRFMAAPLLATAHGIGGIAFDGPFDPAAYARTLPASFRATMPTPSSTTISVGETPLFTIVHRGSTIEFVRVESTFVRIYPGALGLGTYVEEFAQQPCRNIRSEHVQCTAAGWTFELVGTKYANAKTVSWRR